MCIFTHARMHTHGCEISGAIYNSNSKDQVSLPGYKHLLYYESRFVRLRVCVIAPMALTHPCFSAAEDCREYSE